MICIIQETIHLFNCKIYVNSQCKHLSELFCSQSFTSSPVAQHPRHNDINMICNMFFSRWWDRNFRQVSGQSGSPYQRKRLSYLPCWWLSWQSLVWERHGNLDQWETTWWNIILTDPWGSMLENWIVNKGTHKKLEIYLNLWSPFLNIALGEERSYR